MKKLAILFVFILLVLFTGFTFAGKEDLSGTWVGSTEVDGMEVELTLVLQKKGNEYTGTINDSAGFSQDTEIESVKLEGNDLSFTFPVETGVEIAVQLKIDGSKMTGSWESDDGNYGEIEMNKK
jgi:hypothetical protein